MVPTAACSCVFVMQMAAMCHGGDAKDGEGGTTTCRDYRGGDRFRQVIHLLYGTLIPIYRTRRETGFCRRDPNGDSKGRSTIRIRRTIDLPEQLIRFARRRTGRLRAQLQLNDRRYRRYATG